MQRLRYIQFQEFSPLVRVCGFYIFTKKIVCEKNLLFQSTLKTVFKG